MSRLGQLKPIEVTNALKRAGFVEHHWTGSHLFLWHPQQKRMTQVPFHARDVKRGTMMKILRQAGLTQREFVTLL